MLSGLVIGRLRMASGPMAVSGLHGFYEIPPELLGNPLIGVKAVILMFRVRLIVYLHCADVSIDPYASKQRGTTYVCSRAELAPRADPV